MKKKILATMLCVAMTAGCLAGCGGSSNAGSQIRQEQQRQQQSLPRQMTVQLHQVLVMKKWNSICLSVVLNMQIPLMNC